MPFDVFRFLKKQSLNSHHQIAYINSYQFVASHTFSFVLSRGEAKEKLNIIWTNSLT